MTNREKEAALAWLGFHRRNPLVFRTVCRLLIEKIHAGQETFTRDEIDVIFAERLQWDPKLARYKLGNLKNLAPFYVALFVAQYPHHAPRFRSIVQPGTPAGLNCNAVLLGNDENAIADADQFEFDFGGLEQ